MYGLLPLVVIVVGLLIASALPAPLDVGIVDDELVVRVRGWDVLLAMRSQVRVAVSDVRSIAPRASADVPRTGLRLPGTGIPGVIRAGSYGTGAARDFWLVRRAAEVLVIELGPGSPYRRVVLQVPNPVAMAARLQAQLHPAASG